VLVLSSGFTSMAIIITAMIRISANASRCGRLVLFIATDLAGSYHSLDQCGGCAVRLMRTVINNKLAHMKK